MVGRVECCLVWFCLALRFAAFVRRLLVRNGFDETLKKVQHSKVGLEREDFLIAMWTPFVFGGGGGGGGVFI